MFNLFNRGVNTMSMNIEKRDSGWFVGENGPFANRAKARDYKRELKAGLVEPMTTSEPVRFDPAEMANTSREPAPVEPTESETPKAEPKRRGPKGSGLIQAIREAFEAGAVTVEQVVAVLSEQGKQPSINTIRTQVSGLRRQAGLTDRSGGPVATIRKAFELGNQDVKSITEYLASSGVDASTATIKTQVGKLRREAGLTKKAA